MKPLPKTFLRLLKIGLISAIIIYVGVFLYLRFGWRQFYSKQEVDGIIATISNAPAFPEEFYSLYDKAYDNRQERITTRYWTRFLTDYPMRDNPQWAAANRMEYKGDRYQLGPLTLAFKINATVPPEKCFDYLMAEDFKGYCKTFRLKDSIVNLKEPDKIISFIIAHENPWFYYSHASQFKREKDSLTLILSGR
ncbi:hypothetical protein HB364_30700 [Pseudoflavitalea sp. X16]|uniref:hypothetical protein n=1 Tax=Paraflavitalea devenefica TaxID=2716334 RepID=UPI00142136FE|nr:hypothetical protein [Paraflavitalea devenefica]NII29489.1 hypothetical protein [Paraflavitalea devenefica]